MITNNMQQIPGLVKTLCSDGTPTWRLTIHFQGRRTTRRHESLEAAMAHYRFEKLRQALLQWPPFTAAEQQALVALQHQQAALVPILGPLVEAVLSANGPAITRTRRRQLASHQHGLLANQSQQGTGGTAHRQILFSAYARCWFDVAKQHWSTDSQSITRSLCTKHLIPAFGTYRMCDITVTMVEAWLHQQLTRYSLAQCQNMRKALTSIFYAAVKDGLVPSNPVTNPRCMLPTGATLQRLTQTPQS